MAKMKKYLLLLTTVLVTMNVSAQEFVRSRPAGRNPNAIAALTGGLAAAWFYRRTLTRLQHAELNGRDSNFGMSEGPDDDGV